MTAWAKSVRMEGDLLPRFNDSAEDAAPLFLRLFLLQMLIFNSAQIALLRRNLLQIVAKIKVF